MEGATRCERRAAIEGGAERVERTIERIELRLEHEARGRCVVRAPAGNGVGCGARVKEGELQSEGRARPARLEPSA